MKRRRALRIRLALALMLAVAVGCEQAEPTPRYAPPTRPHAALVLEPPSVAVGQVADLVLAVVTPPDHRPRPADLPEAIPGFWVLGVATPEVQRDPARWVHRTRIRLRAREVGRFSVPAGVVDVEGPDGVAQTVAYDGMPIEVVSVFPHHPDQRTPYGVRLLPVARASGAASLGLFGAGVAFGLSLVGLVWLARRRRTDQAPPTPQAGEAAPRPWEVARQAFARARADLDVDPEASLHETSTALRGFAAARFGGPPTARTTEELVGSKPPFTMTTRWPAFLELLGALDGARFPAPRASPAERRARSLPLIERAEAFVTDALPIEARRE